MGAITKTRSYDYVVNGTITGDITNPDPIYGATYDRRNLLYEIKDALVSMASSPWTVEGSSDSVTAGMDAVDRWTDPLTDLVWEDSGPKSWIVLERADGVQLCIVCQAPSFSQNGSNIEIWLSTGDDFTGGTTIDRPTSPSEVDLAAAASGGWSGSAGASARTYRLHVIQSTDGGSTFVRVCYNGYTLMHLDIIAFDDAPSGWKTPVMSLYSSAKSDSHSLTTVVLYGSTPPIHTYHPDVAGGSGQIQSYPGIGSQGTTRLESDITVANSVSGAVEMLPLSIGTFGQGPVIGRMGTWLDVWAPTVGATGDSYPAAQPDWARFDNLVIPWDGVSTPALT